MPHINRNGIRIYYESHGQGPPIVLLHPLTTNRYIWTNQIFTFAREHQVIVIDHRGHGLSDKPSSGYAITEMAADLIAVLDEAGVAKAVLLVLEGGTSTATKEHRKEVCDFLSSVYRIPDNFTRAVFLASIDDANGFFHWNICDQLKDIHQPTLVLEGAEDRAIPPGSCKLLADKIPGAELKIIPEVGHYYPIEEPSKFNDDLRAFLGRLPAWGNAKEQ